MIHINFRSRKASASSVCGNRSQQTVHLMQNQFINDIYHAIDHNQMGHASHPTVAPTSGHINRYDRERQAIFIEQDRLSA